MTRVCIAPLSPRTFFDSCFCSRLQNVRGRFRASALCSSGKQLRVALTAPRDREFSSCLKQAQALADSPDVVVPVQIWTKVDGMITMLGSCDVPVSSLLTAAASLAGRSTRPRINKPVLAPMDQWFPVRSSSGSLVGRARIVCEVVPLSVSHDDAATVDAGGFLPNEAASAAAAVDADVASMPSLEVLEIMRSRIRTEVLCPLGSLHR